VGKTGSAARGFDTAAFFADAAAFFGGAAGFFAVTAGFFADAAAFFGDAAGFFAVFVPGFEAFLGAALRFLGVTPLFPAPFFAGASFFITTPLFMNIAQAGFQGEYIIKCGVWLSFFWGFPHSRL
jgi:hypothetical protein